MPPGRAKRPPRVSSRSNLTEALDLGAVLPLVRVVRVHDEVVDRVVGAVPGNGADLTQTLGPEPARQIHYPLMGGAVFAKDLVGRFRAARLDLAVVERRVPLGETIEQGARRVPGRGPQNILEHDLERS